ncbi:hypothetical protein COBT_001874 [Conglomerata obtusa]
MNVNTITLKSINKSTLKNNYIEKLIYKPNNIEHKGIINIQENNDKFEIFSKNNLNMNKKTSNKVLCVNSCEICCLEQNMLFNWKVFMRDEFEKPYFYKLKKCLHKKNFLPQAKDIFKFTHFFPVEQTKIVIVGQDPFHDPKRASGLAFSSTKISSSLRNIYNEIKRTYYDFDIPNHGNLDHWASQGVLLINTILTVEVNKPDSHKNIGWEFFTKSLISKISKYEKIVFMLLGKYAQTLIKHVSKDNLILLSSHPSAKGVRESFCGNNHFILANEYLQKNNKNPIKW